MLTVKHKGDHLTFAALGASVGLDYEVKKCEILPGIFRRYHDHFDSRSSISRDGYISLMHYIVYNQDIDLLDRIIDAGKKRKWDFDTMPHLKSSKDYTNMAILSPLFFAIRKKLKKERSFLAHILLSFYCNPPILNAKTGFRAHLIAMVVLLAMRLGVKSFYHKIILAKLVKYNQGNPLFTILLYKITKQAYDYDTITKNFDYNIGCYGWGSCEPKVFEELCYWVHINL